MAWSASAIFRQYVADILGNTTSVDINTDSLKIALYNNTPTPDKDTTAALSAYNASTSQWLTANEVYDTGEWAQAGQVLDSPTITTPSTGVIMFDAADEASGSSATLLNVFGGLIYDDTVTTPVADQGVCYLYFGGANSVTDGTMTIVFNANGIFRITV